MWLVFSFSIILIKKISYEDMMWGVLFDPLLIHSRSRALTALAMIVVNFFIRTPRWTFRCHAMLSGSYLFTAHTT